MMSDSIAVQSLEEQLRSLYADREVLTDRFGASSAEEIIGMIESLEAQLRDFYGRFGHTGTDDTETALILARIKELSSILDPMYSKKSVSFSIENDRPVLKAEWSQHNGEVESI